MQHEDRVVQKEGDHRSLDRECCADMHDGRTTAASSTIRTTCELETCCGQCDDHLVGDKWLREPRAEDTSH